MPFKLLCPNGQLISQTQEDDGDSHIQTTAIFHTNASFARSCVSPIPSLSEESTDTEPPKLACPSYAAPSHIQSTVADKYSKIPKVKIDLNPQRTSQNRYSRNKTALYIEPRENIKHITPLLVHMMEVVPPEWRFVFLGTEKTAQLAAISGSAQRYQDWGRLRIGKLDVWTAQWGPRWEDLSIEEMHNRLLTNASFYDLELPGVEHLFVFHSDGVLCANSHRDLNDWLQYDWVGAPWSKSDRFGGRGGLSLRSVSKTLQVLRFQKRLDHTADEDSWLSSRIGLLPGANMATPDVEQEFAVDNVWTERPMGYHLNRGDLSDEVWGKYERRRMIYEYCPEVKIILDMRLERERCYRLVEEQVSQDFVSSPPTAVENHAKGVVEGQQLGENGQPKHDNKDGTLDK